MFSNTVFVIIGAVFVLSQAADFKNNKPESLISFYQPADGRLRLSSRSIEIEKETINNIFNKTSEDPPKSNSSSSSSSNSTSKKPTPIDDTEYWDNDDFQPYKVDKRDFFDWRLIEDVFIKQKTNVIISPFSVKFVLALLYEAADAESNTKRELFSVFYGISSPLLMQDIYQELLESLKEPSSKYTLNFATKMYLRNSINPRPKYQSTLKDKYNTEIQGLDFSQAKESAEIINNWCSNVTEGRLQNLVNSDNLESATLLLVNAIFFDGKWRSPFTETFESVFFRQPTEQIRAKYMTTTSKFNYFYSTMWNAKIIRLPYQGRKFSMTIIMPSAKGGIEELIREIEGDGLRRVQWLMTEQEVKVTLPKFKFDFTGHLKDTLMSLGINDIFSEGASLGGIAKGSSLDRKMRVTDIIQKAGIEVHETGSTAFAATDVEIVNKFGGDNIEEFNANRPFIFIIVDEGANNILFAGKVLDPTI